MSRYGRNQKRAHRARIAELEALVDEGLRREARDAALHLTIVARLKRELSIWRPYTKVERTPDARFRLVHEIAEETLWAARDPEQIIEAGLDQMREEWRRKAHDLRGI